MKLINEDITKQTTGFILHGTNTRGVMNAGVAKAIRNMWPQVYTQFKKNGSGEHLLGTLDIIKINSTLYVGNGYTQLNYGRDGKQYADIKAVESVIQQAFYWVAMNNQQLSELYDSPQLFVLKSSKIASVLGGLDWETQVKPVFEKYEQLSGAEVEIYYI